MGGHYGRTADERRRDHHESKAFEQLVLSHLPKDTVDESSSTTRLDFFVKSPGTPYVLDVKERKQTYNKRWHRLPDTDPDNLFILDELSFRKGMTIEGGYQIPAFFLLHDAQRLRLFLASIPELMVVDRVRVNRVGGTGHPKGKWLIDATHFRPVELPTLHDSVQAAIEKDKERWAWSECLSYRDVPNA